MDPRGETGQPGNPHASLPTVEAENDETHHHQKRPVDPGSGSTRRLRPTVTYPCSKPDVAIPKLRTGSYFLDWLLERRRRAEAALTSVVATCYLLGVSTRRMEKLVDSLGITRLSKSQVSAMAKDLDEQVHAFRARPLAPAPTRSSPPTRWF